jgi:hypothetical protein
MFSRSKVELGSATIYIHHICTHMHILIWLYDLTLFGSIVWLYNICFASTYALSPYLWAPHKPKLYDEREDIISLLPWWGSTKYHILRELRGSYEGISEFYFENLQKLRDNGWTKSLGHSAWLDHSAFQLLKTQVKAISLIFEGNMSMFGSWNSLL